MVFPASLSLVLIFPWTGLPCSARLSNVQSCTHGGVWVFFLKVALRNDSILWMHTDPVSRMNESVEVQVIESTL